MGTGCNDCKIAALFSAGGFFFFSLGVLICGPTASADFAWESFATTANSIKFVLKSKYYNKNMELAITCYDNCSRLYI